MDSAPSRRAARKNERGKEPFQPIRARPSAATGDRSRPTSMNRSAEHRLGPLSAIVCQLAGAVPGGPFSVLAFHCMAGGHGTAPEPERRAPARQGSLAAMVLPAGRKVRADSPATR